MGSDYTDMPSELIDQVLNSTETYEDFINLSKVDARTYAVRCGLLPKVVGKFFKYYKCRYQKENLSATVTIFKDGKLFRMTADYGGIAVNHDRYIKDYTIAVYKYGELMIIPLKDNVVDGVVKVFDMKGNIYATINVKDGVLHGHTVIHASPHREYVSFNKGIIEWAGYLITGLLFKIPGIGLFEGNMYHDGMEIYFTGKKMAVLTDNIETTIETSRVIWKALFSLTNIFNYGYTKFFRSLPFYRTATRNDIDMGLDVD